MIRGFFPEAASRRAARRMSAALLVACLAVSARAADTPADLTFRHLTPADGLSNGVVNVVYQDRVGFLWFGTRDGLNLYDGRRFTVYRPDISDPNSLSSPVIRDIDEGADGVLWIGTETGGLNRLDAASQTITRFQNDPADPATLSNNRVQNLAIGPDGAVWAATYGGLNRIDPASGRIVRYLHDPADPASLARDDLNDVAVDPSGRVWVATRGGGVDRLDPATGRFDHFRADAADPARGPAEDRVNALLITPDGGVWMGGETGGLSRFDPASGTFSHYDPRPSGAAPEDHFQINTIARDETGLLWLGTWGDGLYLFDPASGRTTQVAADPESPDGLADQHVQSVLKDREGQIWLGLRNGVDHHSHLHRKFALTRNDPRDDATLSPGNIWAIHRARSGALWVGTGGGGLNRLDAATGRWTHLVHDPANPRTLTTDFVSTICEDGDGVLWIGTRGGLNRLDPGTGDVARFVHARGDDASLSDNFIFSCLIDRDGALWLGTRVGGLNRFDPETGAFANFRNDPADPNSLGQDWVGAIHQDGTGALWLGTKDGLDRFDPQTGSFSHHLTDLGIPIQVFSIQAGENGALWIGSSLGLFRYEPESRAYRLYTARDGLPSDSISAILPDASGKLWLSTLGGLSVFDPRTERFQNFDAADGLQGPEFRPGAAFRDADGRLYFGGDAGFNDFDPALIGVNPVPPRVALTRMRLFNEPVAIGPGSPLAASVTRLGLTGGAITLDHGQNILDFDFAALSFIAPEKNRYRARLLGLTDRWTEIGAERAFVSYAGLPPGPYRLQVQGSNDSLVWSENTAELDIRITPPWWQQWWFRGALAGTLALAVLIFIRWRTHSVRRRNRLLEATVRERTQELREKNAELTRLSTTDALTGLCNRGKLDAVFADELQRAARFGHPFCIIMIDLDHFKRINDTHGHPVGDQVLVAMAALFSQNIRATDTVGRWGGEEFLIICPGTDSEGTRKLAETLRAAVAADTFPQVGQMTASFGITAYRAGDTPQAMTERADQALYNAKQHGRDRVEVFEPGPNRH